MDRSRLYLQNKGVSSSSEASRRSSIADSGEGTSGTSGKRDEAESVVHNRAMSKAVKVVLLASLSVLIFEC
jgi:hypothetical protein